MQFISVTQAWMKNKVQIDLLPSHDHCRWIFDILYLKLITEINNSLNGHSFSIQQKLELYKKLEDTRPFFYFLKKQKTL